MSKWPGDRDLEREVMVGDVVVIWGEAAVAGQRSVR